MNRIDTSNLLPTTEQLGGDSVGLRQSRRRTTSLHVLMWRDLAVVATLTVATFAVSAELELSEAILRSTRAFEAFEIDELPISLLALALSSAWFAWRRWRDSRFELARRLEIEDELQRSERECRMLSRHCIAIQEAERRHLARELHDELGQYLNAIKIDAVGIREMSREALPDIHASAVSIVGITNHVYEVVRRMMGRLRPVALDDLGLVAAMQHCVDGWQQRLPQTRFEFSAEGVLESLDEEVNMTLYRVVQECLTNIARHAEAANVAVRMERGRTAAQVNLSVTDNGKGMDPQRVRSGFGVVGMRERVAALGGCFELQSAPGQGMSVRVSIPLPARVQRHGDD